MNSFYTNKLIALESSRLTWWSKGIKRTWILDKGKRVWGWELI